MTITSNSQFLHVTTPGPAEQTGWEVRVLDHKDFSSVVAVISDYTDLTISPTLGQAGEASITLDANSPLWTDVLSNGRPAATLLDHEHLWQALENGQPRFEWLGTTVEEHLAEDDENRQITVSGPGAANVLTWACVMPPTFPEEFLDTAPIREPRYTDNYYWKFPFTWPLMKMWLHLLRVSQARGTVPWINPQFTEDRDSAGHRWEVVPTQESVAEPDNGLRPEPGTNLLDLLNIHTGQDLTHYGVEWLEWYMWPGFRLDVRKQIGGHREHDVIFFDGAIEQKERTRVRDEISNFICTIDVNGASSLAVDDASMKDWNKREKLQTNNENIIDPVKRAAIGQVYLRWYKNQKSQWVVQVPYDEDGRRPFVDYHIGDWIGINTVSPDAATSTTEPYRVLAMTIRVVDQAVTVELTLQTLLEAQIRELQKQLTTLINKPANNQPDPNIVPPLDSGAAPPSGPVNWSPDKGYYIDPTAGFGTGVSVFIQPDDPGTKAKIGDFWFDTDYQPPVTPNPWTPPSIGTATPAPAVDTIPIPNGSARIPNPTVTYAT